MLTSVFGDSSRSSRSGTRVSSGLRRRGDLELFSTSRALPVTDPNARDLETVLVTLVPIVVQRLAHFFDDARVGARRDQPCICPTRARSERQRE